MVIDGARAVHGESGRGDAKTTDPEAGRRKAVAAAHDRSRELQSSRGSGGWGGRRLSIASGYSERMFREVRAGLYHPV